MLRISLRVLVASMSVALLLSTFAAGDAEANPYKGKIKTSKKRYPTSAKSKRAYFAKIKKQSGTKFWEDTEKKQWKIYYIAFFKRPLNDLEVTVKIYDITEKQRSMKVAYEQYLDRRGQKEIISHITLDREKFGVNRRLEMTIENRGKVLARGRFQILGEAEKYSGKVDFSEEEANSKAP